MNEKNKWYILFTVITITFMATLDSSIVNVALPVMADELAITMNSVEWVVTSYLIAICATILIFGRLGDIKNKVLIFKSGMVIFTIGSLLCGISENLVLLIVSRVIQALGAAAAMSTNQGIITETFPKSERGRALGIIGSAAALGTMVGPTLGGLIVDKLTWNYIFLINIPIGIIVFFISLKTLPIGEVKSGSKLDVLGSVLSAVSIIMIFTAVILGQSLSYSNPYILLAIVLGFILLSIFIFLERKKANPLLDISIFKNKLFSLSIFCGFTSFIALSGSNIILPFYFEDALNLSPSYTGIIMTVSPIILGVVAPLSGYLSDKIGSEIITFIGLGLTTVGLLLIAFLNITTPIYLIVLFIGIMSLGNAMFQSPNNSLIMSTVSKDKLGVAGSINSLIRNLGMITGISLSTTLLYSIMSNKIGYKVLSYVEGRSDVFIYGMKIVYIVVAIICSIGAILTLIRLLKGKTDDRSKDYM